MASQLLLLATVLTLICTLSARRLKEDLAGNFINCQNVGVGAVDDNLLQTASQAEEVLFGYFISKGVARPVDATISVKLLRDLKVDVDQASSTMGVVKQGRRWSSMWPAIVWCNNRWHTVTRFIDEAGLGWQMSNYLLTQMFSEKFEPASPSRLVGLPTFLNGVPYAGLEDPRLMVRKGHLLIEGNMHYPHPNTRADISRVGVFDAGTSAGYVLDVPGQTLYNWEKSWIGFVKDDTLHFLYSLQPLVELACKDGGDCDVTFHQERCPVPPCVGVSPHGAEGEARFLRGGSSMIPWNSSVSPDYYVGFAHTTLTGGTWAEASDGLNVAHPPPGIRWHKIHMFVYNAKEHRIVYVSGPISLGAATLQLLATRWNGAIQDPTSVVLTPEGHFVMGMNVDDSHPVIAAVGGLAPIIDAVIRMDQSPAEAAAGSVPGPEDVSDPDVLKCTMHAVRKYLRKLDGRIAP